ncbi:MAG: hypothetical protein FWD57_13920 [Polyangiaceae bacterium]|nr:hypothetical protein [Polyangiaceae bacterium]
MQFGANAGGDHKPAARCADVREDLQKCDGSSGDGTEAESGDRICQELTTTVAVIGGSHRWQSSMAVIGGCLR